jgi:hypothetical protein
MSADQNQGTTAKSKRQNSKVNPFEQEALGIVKDTNLTADFYNIQARSQNPDSSCSINVHEMNVSPDELHSGEGCASD